MTESAVCCGRVLARSSGSATATNAMNATTSASEPRVVRVTSARSLDLDRLDLVADLDRLNDVHAARDESEVRVLTVEERRVFLDNEPLGTVVDRRVGSARYAD